jgi:hypothetical protein
MNTNLDTIERPVIPTTDLLPAHTSDPPPESAPTTANPILGTGLSRANGKIARLPKPIRDQINHWMLDGVSYPDIIQRLGEQGKDLKPDNLSQGKKRGHQDWLVEQAFIERTRARQETPGELVRDFDATEVNHAALQLATLHIFETLRDLVPAPGSHSDSLSSEAVGPADDAGASKNQKSKIENASDGEPAQIENQKSKIKNHRRSLLDVKLGGDSAAFVRLINALARASRETMLLQKYRTACAQARAALSELKDPKRKLTEAERRSIVLQVDDILGLGSPEDDEPEPGDQLPESSANPSPDSIPSSSSSSSSSLGSAPNDQPGFATTA